ncbi:uncharacterized protein LOC142327081 isoform X3 [Lycorma delicatula]
MLKKLKLISLLVERMASIETVSNEYFKSINSLAEKIADDLDSTRQAYQELWYKLSSEEQKQVLDEAIIDPAAVLKYSRIPDPNPVWKDNASSDFSWFTKSQLNLFTVSGLRGEKMKTPVKRPEVFSPAMMRLEGVTSVETKTKNQNESNLLNKLKNKVPVLKNSSNEEKQSLVENRSQVNLTSKSTISKPKTPPPPPPNKSNIHTERRALLSTDNESDHSEDIPKTGFDFLDN